MQPQMVTPELIQKYLDENQQLILAILENQNLGKLNECVAYQGRLQQNLMYLAAIADAQRPASASPPVPPPASQMPHIPQNQMQGPPHQAHATASASASGVVYPGVQQIAHQSAQPIAQPAQSYNPAPNFPGAQGSAALS
eukprot:CAMPEP_0198212094 /NCGR_PEP_ID=MMETSP1445-20131203/25519_1 /TAXON_ID=36898 /ORGANISM="Pyramimonas sp., Strain CCMP2087" /LENGTH=139 /DNA_ID=CAMNT_0043886473 /DNA_START=209 /DNA_END=625 /DNA_ORIENTATION=+